MYHTYQTTILLSFAILGDLLINLQTVRHDPISPHKYRRGHYSANTQLTNIEGFVHTLNASTNSEARTTYEHNNRSQRKRLELNRKSNIRSQNKSRTENRLFNRIGKNSLRRNQTTSECHCTLHNRNNSILQLFIRSLNIMRPLWRQQRSQQSGKNKFTKAIYGIIETYRPE